MDIGRAISFPFDDDEWPAKIIIGTLLSFIPFIAQGYQVSVARNVIRDQERPLPGVENVGQVIIDGILTVIAGIIYFLPLILVGCLFFFPLAMAGDSDLGALVLCLSSTCIFVLALVYIIPATALYWVGVIRYAKTGNFSEFMRIGALWQDVMDNTGTLLSLLVYSLLLGLLGMLVASVVWITCIGLPLLSFYYQIASGHLIGQAGIVITED